MAEEESRVNLSRSGFLWASLLLTGTIAFFTISIDQSSVDHFAVVGELDEQQLLSVKRTLADMQALSSEAHEIRDAVTELEWVHHVNVRKNWPSGFYLEVYPESVIAYWNDDAFINEEGRVLVTDLVIGGDLPHLYGPSGSELEVMTQYQQLSRMLNVYGHEIKVLNRSDRGSWSLETRDKLEVLLGKEDLKARMQRFLTVSARLNESKDDRVVERMDARYVNGVAVHFSDSNQLNLADITKSVGEQSL
jgi:cell division protein FtsQ